ncbi:energy transducer TonB [candidate division KSB1 bacterium]
MDLKKSVKADLERKRGFFFQIGLILTLSAVLVAFQWKDEIGESIVLEGGFDIMFEDEIIITKQEEPKQQKPEIPSVPIFDIGSDDMDDDSFELFDIEDDPEKALKTINMDQFIFEEPVEGADPPFVFIAEDMPDFKGGEHERQLFLRKNIKYPELAREIGIEGIVHIGFIVEKDGSLSNIKLLRGIGGGCDEEALRVSKMMPDWNPGTQRNKPVRVKMSMPIHFKLLN